MDFLQVFHMFYMWRNVMAIFIFLCVLLFSKLFVFLCNLKYFFSFV